jgi:hypothetical protein
MRRGLRRARTEAQKTEPDKNTYLVFGHALSGADPGYDGLVHRRSSSFADPWATAICASSGESLLAGAKPSDLVYAVGTYDSARSPDGRAAATPVNTAPLTRAAPATTESARFPAINARSFRGARGPYASVRPANLTDHCRLLG